MRRAALALVVALFVGIAVAEDEKPEPLGPPPKKLKLDRFYKKYVSADGLPVVSSKKVSDDALRAAAFLVGRMCAKRPDVRKALIEAKVRVAVMAPTEVTTDIPEHRTLTPKAYWDKRARGLGATVARPACSCAEENLLGLPGDRYKGESILIHEFAHTFHTMGLNRVDATFQKKLETLYAKAKKAKTWDKTYAATDVLEYWAEGVQSWFDANLEVDPPNGIHNHVNTREELEKHDPALAKLIASVFKDDPWRWTPPTKAPKPNK